METLTGHHRDKGTGPVGPLVDRSTGSDVSKGGKAGAPRAPPTSTPRDTGFQHRGSTGPDTTTAPRRVRRGRSVNWLSQPTPTDSRLVGQLVEQDGRPCPRPWVNWSAGLPLGCFQVLCLGQLVERTPREPSGTTPPGERKTPPPPVLLTSPPSFLPTRHLVSFCRLPSGTSPRLPDVAGSQKREVLKMGRTDHCRAYTQ